jgi:hypothetical protein
MVDPLLKLFVPNMLALQNPLAMVEIPCNYRGSDSLSVRIPVLSLTRFKTNEEPAEKHDKGTPIEGFTSRYGAVQCVELYINLSFSMGN